MSDKHAHLQMIQGVISRLSNNSFLLKGWSVILVSAMLALSAKGTQWATVYLACFPALAFWGLDGYFVRQERLYRTLYDSVRQTADEQIDFSMDTTALHGAVAPWIRTVASTTLIAFHGAVLVSIAAVAYISRC